MEKRVEKGALLAPSPARFQVKSNSERVITWRFFFTPCFPWCISAIDVFEFLCVICTYDDFKS